MNLDSVQQKVEVLLDEAEIADDLGRAAEIREAAVETRMKAVRVKLARDRAFAAQGGNESTGTCSPKCLCDCQGSNCPSSAERWLSGPIFGISSVPQWTSLICLISLNWFI